MRQIRNSGEGEYCCKGWAGGDEDQKFKEETYLQSYGIAFSAC